MSEHKQAAALATAAMMEMIARAQAMQAAIMRGDPPERVEAMRQGVVAAAEAYADHMVEAATHVRQIIEP